MRLFLTIYGAVGALTVVVLMLFKRLDIHPAFHDLPRLSYHFSTIVNVLAIMICSPIIILALGFELFYNLFFDN